MQFEYLKAVTGGLDKNAVLEDLMSAHGKDVWNFAFFLTKSSVIADDITQDVFVKVFEKMYTYRGQSSVKTWLLAITRNTAMDAMRSAWIRRVTTLPSWFQGKTHPSAEQEVLSQIVTEQVWSDVLSLPRKLREILLLHIHHGLPIKEVSALLEISEGTVKSRLHRARAAMNRKLDQDDDGEGPV
ncbi:sigma-70 family RNA polymerase sigma factor [Paenibacillaceae bacterium]|nr:sigma-70 family RNA polymerase sigma factor [Paenibacillaceae bacterium]